MLYPLLEGKKMDSLRQSAFDYWKQQIYEKILDSGDASEGISKDSAMIIAFNCAFLIVTDK